MYKKSQGTSAIHGHLYETKLLSLILFRALHDNNIEEFYLASNIADIGVFDDICFKAKTKEGKPLVVFIQAKHSKDTIQTLNKRSNVVKYFNSYIKIKSKFNPTCEDNIFNTEFNETECLFVVYTTAEGSRNNNDIEIPVILNSLLATEQLNSQLLYGEQSVQLIAKIITSSVLAASFAKFLYDKYDTQCIHLRDLKNDILLRYHVILAKHVVDVTEKVNARQRKCKFREDFFKTRDQFLTMLRDNLYLEILKNQKLEKTMQHELLSQFLAEPSENTLLPVIGRIIWYDDGKFEFVQKHTSSSLRDELRQIDLPESTVKSAIRQAALNIMQSSDQLFMVPSTFGNIDIKENEIRNLTFKISELLKTATLKRTSEGNIVKVVTINETVKDRILLLNRNLGSTVGNILCCDKGNQLLRFVKNDSSINSNAKTLLTNLSNTFKNLEGYRFDVKNVQFPKLTYNYINEELTRGFLSKLVLYAGQANQSGVEDKLKELIQTRQITSGNFRIKSDAIFLKYHDKIQSWWISSSKEAQYLTKTHNIYQEIVDNIVSNSIMTIVDMMYMNKIKSLYYTFSENAIKLLSPSLNIFTKSKSEELCELLIITDSARLTVSKVTNYLKMQYVVLDLKYILELLPDDYCALISELECTNRDDTFILVCDLDNFETSRESKIIHDKLKQIVAVSNDKKKIIITNEIIVETISKYIGYTNKTPFPEKHSLLDFNPESRKNILKNCRVIFQGHDLNLNLLIDDKSMKLIEGKVLDEIIFGKEIKIGDSLTDPNYDSIKHLYINRRLSRNQTTIEMQTLHNIQEDIVLLTGKAGMGKSTFLTHLSLKTKKRNKKLWIVKINLLYHSGELNTLQKKEKTSDKFEALMFMCLVLVKINQQLRTPSLDLENLKITLHKTDGEVCIDEFSGNQWAKFELDMFLHFYNKGYVVFLFDGFDEICPYYKDTVITLINALREDIQGKKIDCSTYLPWPQVWITSRAYNELQSFLQKHYSSPYELDNFTLSQLNVYLDTFWESNLIFSEFNEKHIAKIQLFLDNTSSVRIINNFTLSGSLGRVHSSFICYIITNFPEIDGIVRWHHLYQEMKFLREYIPGNTDTAFTNNEMECPLITCLAANYFIRYLKNPEEYNATQSFNIDASSVYEWLMEAVVQKHYKDKKKIDLDNAFNKMDYESKLPKYIEKHKKIAAYAVFQRDIYHIFDEEQLRKIEVLINTIMKGEEVIGLTCSVLENIPQFSHITFAQYLAVEFLFDLLKCKNMVACKRREILTNVVYNQLDSFCIWLNHKLETNKARFILYSLETEEIDLEMVSTI